MPIYEFMCKECGNVFEKLVFGTDDQSVSCSKCDGNVKKLPSAANIAGASSGSVSDGCAPGAPRGFS